MSTLTCEIGENPPSVCLLAENPNRLVSLWDMLRIYAANFIRVGARFERCTSDIRLITNPDDQASEVMMGRFNDLIETLRLDATEMELEHTPEFTEAFATNAKHGLTYNTLAHAVENMHRIYQSELRHRLFLYSPVGRAKYWEQDELFGSEVNTAFPSCALEIKDAGNCYAVEQDTACVMHLMRTLEVVLGVLAKEFGEAFKREQWQNIIERIQKLVNSLGPSDSPDWKDKQTFYSNACSHFLHFKNAWRNHAMHARERYNGPEAFSVLDHVMKFMQILATRLREPE